MDAQLGRVLNALEKSAYAKNTIVVLFSDHGFHLGEKQRWAKQSLWETSTHVPMIFSVPGGLKGRMCARPVELIQVFPTLVELCGIKKRKGLEGVSIKALLDEPESEWTLPALTTFKQNNHAVRSERWRYIRYSDGSEELYDHSKDPNEWTNLAGRPEHAAVIREHARWLPKINVPNTAAGLPAKRQKKKKQR
jgi:arylsulfatase A-like enzyme